MVGGGLKVGLDKGEEFFELSEFSLSHASSGAGADAFGDGNDFGPDGFCGGRGFDQLFATVVLVAAAANPAVALHPVEDPDERGGLDAHAFGQVGL